MIRALACSDRSAGHIDQLGRVEAHMASPSWLDRFREGLVLEGSSSSPLRMSPDRSRFSMVLLILTTSITLESPKGGGRAAGTSENEVRFGISVCSAGPVDAREDACPLLDGRPIRLR
jgi:hypothetical protein